MRPGERLRHTAAEWTDATRCTHRAHATMLRLELAFHGAADPD